MPSITDWMSSIATRGGRASRCAAAVYAALYTRRRRRAGAKAATEAANQVRELQLLREPKALVMFRVPDQLTAKPSSIRSTGNYPVQNGTPVFLTFGMRAGPNNHGHGGRDRSERCAVSAGNGRIRSPRNV